MNDVGTLKSIRTQFLPTMRVSELAGVTPVPLEFIDGHGLFVKGDLNYFMGAGAVGKTTLMAQLGAAVGLSESTFRGPALWLGRPVTTRGPVMFVSAEEDINALHRKMLEVCADQGTTLKDLSNFLIHDLTRRDGNALLSCEGRGKPVRKKPLFDTFENSVAAIKPVLIIIDNRAQVIDADEIDRNVATFVGNTFRAIAAKYRATVVLLAHPSLTGMKTGSSGSTGWNNTTRNTVLMCKPEDRTENDDTGLDDGKRQLTVPKANYGPMGLRANLQWRCGVYYCTDKPERSDDGIGKASKGERVFMKLMQVYAKRGIELSAAPQARNFAPSVFFADGAREGVSKPALHSAMLGLIDQGKISVTTVGIGTRQKRLLVIAAED